MIVLYGYIYLTTDKKYNKIYIGKHKSSKFDKKYFGSGKIIGVLIKEAKARGDLYSRFSIEVLEWCESLEELNLKEEYWISKYDARNPDIGYNIAKGGDGGDIFSTLSLEKQAEFRENCSIRESAIEGKKLVHKNDVSIFVDLCELSAYLNDGWILGSTDKYKYECRRRMRRLIDSGKIKFASLKGENSPMFGKPKTSETKANISKSKRGTIRINNGEVMKNVRPEQLDEYLSNGFVLGGLPQSDSTRKHISESAKNRGPMSLESKQKMSNSLKGRKFTNSHREKISNSIKGRIHVCNENGTRMIKSEELDEYLKNGYVLGRKFKNINRD